MSPEGVFGLKGSFTPEEEGEYLTMTIGVHNNHAFLITDLEKAAKIYECNHCGARFTKSTNLLRHAESCSLGKKEQLVPICSIWEHEVSIYLGKKEQLVRIVVFENTKFLFIWVKRNNWFLFVVLGNTKFLFI